MTEQTTPTHPSMVRLHKASIVLQLLAAHPELAAAPIDWEIDGRDDLWLRAPYGSPDAGPAAELLAATLGVQPNVTDVKGGPMYEVYGHWAGCKVNLQAWGPKHAAADEVAA